MAKPAKKGAPTALQTEVSTDDEWEQILNRKGLVLVDIYSEWSGPCVAMVSTLKRVKIEIGGDSLSYAVAKSDGISALERFRGKSEPVWMFLQNRNMVNLFYGAHCPNLNRLLIEEIRRVQQDEPPKWSLPVTQRGPVEEFRWQQKEAKRRSVEKRKVAKEEAEKRDKYEKFMEHQMTELCEEIGLIVYPWVFLDEEGNPRDEAKCPAFWELVRDTLPERFDILEQSKIQLDEEIIEKLFIESGVEITENLIEGLTEGKCMALRLKGRPPPPEWPVSYPNDCPEGTKPCPIRAFNDIENYLRSMLATPPSAETSSIEGTYLDRHIYVHEPDPEIEGDRQKIYPAVWFPPHARSKVHAFKTLFSRYVEKTHPYEEPVPPLPLCAFKFDATKFAALSDAYQLHTSAIENFGAFEYDAPSLARRIASNPENYETKVKYKTGNEIFVIVIRKINEEAFLAFAGNEPFFVTEENAEAERIVEEYFPPGAVDVIPQDPAEEEEEEDYYYEDYEEEEEEEKEEGEDEEDASGVPPSFVDLSMF